MAINNDEPGEQTRAQQAPTHDESAPAAHDAPQAHEVHEYSATRRTPRQHRRVVMRGTERFDADGVKLEPSDMQTHDQRDADDDQRILGELPPHWGVFEERQG